MAALEQIFWSSEMLDLLISTWKELVIGKVMEGKTNRCGFAYQKLAEKLADSFEHLAPDRVPMKQLKGTVTNKVKYLKSKYYDAVKMNRSGVGRDDIPSSVHMFSERNRKENQGHNFLRKVHVYRMCSVLLGPSAQVFENFKYCTLVSMEQYKHLWEITALILETTQLQHFSFVTCNIIGLGRLSVCPLLTAQKLFHPFHQISHSSTL